MGDEAAPEDSLAALLKGRLPVVDTSGALTSVPADRYEAATRQGYRFQTPEEQGKYHEHLKFKGQGIGAAIEGVARGATLGISDLVEPALGISTRENIQGRKEENPKLAVAGDVAGTIGTLLIPGLGEASGPGLVAKLGHGAEHLIAGEGANLVTRLAAKAAGAGIEGLTYGAAQTVNEAYLGNTELNAEKLTAGMGMGLVLGVGAGVLGGGIGEGYRALKPVLREGATNLADRYTLKAAGGIQSDINKLSNEERSSVAQMLRGRGHIKAGGTPEGVFRSVERDLTEQSKALGKELGLDLVENGHLTPLTPGDATADIVAPAREAHGKVIGAVLEDADASGAHFNFSQAKVRIRELKQGLNAAERRIAEPALNAVIDDLEAEAEKAGEKGGFAAANDLKSTHYEDINWGGESKAKNNIMKQAAGILNDEIESQLKPIAGEEFFKRFEEAKRQYGMLAEAEKLANRGKSGKAILDMLLERSGQATETVRDYHLLSRAYDIGQKGLNRMQGNQAFGLGDKLAGIGLGSLAGGPLGLVTGAAGAVGNKLLRERGPSIIANMAAKIAENPVMGTVAEHFAGAVAKSQEQFGKYGPQLADAAARSPAEALATHIELAKTDHNYRDAAALAGITLESSHIEAKAALDKAHALTGVKHALEGHDDKVGQLVEKALHKGGDVAAEHHAASSVLKKQEFGSKRQRKSPEAAHETHVAEIQRLAANPAAIAERVAKNLGGLGEHAPATVAAMTATATKAVAFLASKAERPNAGSPLAHDWRPSAAEIAKFNRYYEAVQDPHTVLRQAAQGRLTPEALEAVKAVYPQLYSEIQRSITSRLAEKPQGVPYAKRVQLSILAGMDVDGTMSPAAIQRQQAVFHRPSAKGPEDQAGPIKPTQGGASKLTLSRRSMTPLQETANRER